MILRMRCIIEFLTLRYSNAPKYQAFSPSLGFTSCDGWGMQYAWMTTACLSVSSLGTHNRKVQH